jgi:hypothetical protein
MLSENNFSLNENTLDIDNGSLCSELSHIGNSRDTMLTVGDAKEIESDVLPGEISEERLSPRSFTNEKYEGNATHAPHFKSQGVHGDTSAEGTNGTTNGNKCEILAVLSCLPEDMQTELQDDRNGESTENFAVAAETLSSHDKGKSKPKRFKFERHQEYFDERSMTTSNLSLGFPVFDSGRMSKEISKMYEDVCP